ncbi:tetratricopeptide repeat protein [Actinacidiphila sp. bgisy167]|uniref:serine/threonine-protein kinase n=1 Tax=Actinacidiphila sp. bgisy167 TaxID=3413797 RepID=UPI003D7454C2
MSCQRPGCDGTIEDVGGGALFCDTCGLAPLAAEAGTAAGRGGRAGSPPASQRSQPSHPSQPSQPSQPSGAAGTGPGSGVSPRPSGSPQPSGSSRTSGFSRASFRSSRRSVSGRLSRSLSGGTSGAASVSVRSSHSGAGGTTRGKLGAGLVAVPPIPRPDPAAAVLRDPQVPERKRFCSKGDCGAPVGRSRGDRPGRTEGFCTKCGHPYSFTPKLRAGDVVHGQYQVVGCLAHGGLGWIYLAVDRAVNDRWVVLKGLLDTGDEDALAAAVSERRFLAEIAHPNIVRIYNFVEHLDPRGGTLDGYIVMEYVGGKSLKEIANERRGADGRREPLPVDQAIAYAIEALDALGHLHSRNLLYCDFKIDNAIQTEDRLELIDMGAVRRMDDLDSPIYGTVGYQAPEVPEFGPSVASDLYTVARTLAVLTFDFQGYTNAFADSLPDPDGIEVLSRYESFYRLLVRATDPDPGRRFASAEEMSEQLLGVLREVVALGTGKPRPALSPLFGPELGVPDTGLLPPAKDASALGDRGQKGSGGRRSGTAAALAPSAPDAPALPASPPSVTGGHSAGGHGAGGHSAGGRGTGGHSAGGRGTGAAKSPFTMPAQRTAPAPAATGPAVSPLDVRAAALSLPVPHVDPADPNAAFLTGLTAAAPSELVAALQAAPVRSPELRLRTVRARLEGDDAPAALEELRGLREELPEDWRVVWHCGLAALVTRDDGAAALSFDAVYDAFPGEIAPKLALGVCAEVLGQWDNATEYYRLVWTTDQSHVSAAFGLARVLLTTGDRAGAVTTLESVPASSIHYTAARVAAVRARLRGRAPREPLLDHLRAAARQVEDLQRLGLDTRLREQLATEVLGSALDWVLAGRQGAAGPLPAESATPGLLGRDLDERGLRFGLEHSYRVLARLADQGRTRIDLVERANRFRPRTWV